MKSQVIASIDNITINAFARDDLIEWLENEGIPLAKTSKLTRHRDRLFGVKPVPDSFLSYRYKAQYPYSETWVFRDGSIIQSAHEKSDIKPIRLEFNPNKCWWGYIRRFMDFMYMGHITRLDVAIDYHNIDLSSYGIATDRARKGGVFWGKDGKTETVYGGTRNSEQMFRIYDKNKEQGIEGAAPWWRVEIQNKYNPRAKEYLKPEMFDMVTVFKKARQGSGKKIQERAMLEYLINHPNEIAELDKVTQAKYRDMMQEPGIVLKYGPRWFYKNARSKLQKMLYSYVRGAVNYTPDSFELAWENLGQVIEWGTPSVLNMPYPDGEFMNEAFINLWCSDSFYKEIPKLKRNKGKNKHIRKFRVKRK